MRIKGVTYSQQNLHFKQPIITSAGTLKEREIYVLRLETDNGIYAFGESAPLPEFGSENHIEAIDSLRFLTPLLLDRIIPDSFDEIESLLAEMKLTPTVHSALEQCLLESLIHNNSLKEFSQDKNISANALMSLSDTETNMVALKRIVDDEFTTVKIKIGIDDFSVELARLKEIRNTYPAIKLRLDVNGKWEDESALERLNELAELDIEYVEQPVYNLHTMMMLAEKSPTPIAADESIRSEEDALKIINESDINYLVIKPMFISGVLKSKRIIEEAQKKNKQVIVSSSLESNIGRRSLLLAASFSDEKLSHGIATSDIFTDDPTKDVFPVKNGKVEFSLRKFLDLRND